FRGSEIMRYFILACSLLFTIAASGATDASAQDTLLNYDDVVFSDGQDTTSEISSDTLLAVPDDIIFTDGQDTLTPGMTDAPKSLWGIFVAGFLGGFLAILMPCIYPMIPLTVSFFT